MANGRRPGPIGLAGEKRRRNGSNAPISGARPGPIGLEAFPGWSRPMWPRTPPPSLKRGEYPLPGEGEIQLFLRSYAPFKVFGGGYAGDDRGPSTDTSATAKILYVLTFSFVPMQPVGEPYTDCSESKGRGLFPYLMSATAPFSAAVDHQGVVRGRGKAPQATNVAAIGRPGHGFALHAEVSAANPLVGMAADIDVQLNARLERAPGSLRISGSLVGDAFPSAEIFLRDAAGNAILIHHFQTAGDEMGPYHFLPGRNFRPMGRFSTAVPMNDIGLIDTPEFR
jgi:hypothetical protein